MERSKKISWEAFEHIQIERSSDWYWILGIVAVGGAVLAIFFNNLLLALLILIGTFTIFLQSNGEPAIKRYEINRTGVVSGQSIYPFSSLESFWVIDEDGWDRDRILIKSKKLFMPLIIIPLGETVMPDEIRDYLLEYLPEEQMSEPTLQVILNRLGF